MIVLRTPKGWTGPRIVDGLPVEGTWRSHQVPLAGVRDNPEHLAHARGVAAQLPARGALRRVGRGSSPSSPPSRRAGERRMSANPHANGGPLLRDLDLPDFRDYAVEVARPGVGRDRGDPRARRVPPRRDRLQPRRRFRLFGRTRPRRTGWGACSRRPRGPGRPSVEPDDEPGPRRARHGGALRAPVPGLARGLPADRPPRPLQLLRGVHPHRRLDVQPARQVAEGDARHPVAAADRVAQLPAQLARLAPGPQRLLASGSRASSTTS